MDSKHENIWVACGLHPRHELCVQYSYVLIDFTATIRELSAANTKIKDKGFIGLGWCFTSH
jgi:hypothetical protein